MFAVISAASGTERRNGFWHKKQAVPQDPCALLLHSCSVQSRSAFSTVFVPRRTCKIRAGPRLRDRGVGAR